MKFDISAVVLGFVCLICAYQHWLIGQLQEDNISIRKFMLNAHSTEPKQEEQNLRSGAIGKVVVPPAAPAPLPPVTAVEKKGEISQSASFLDLKSPPPMVPQRLANLKETQRDPGGGNKKIYGGAGDEVHLGGFTIRDNNTISFNLWNYMLGPMAVRSFVDVGCGRGFSSKFFLDNGAKVLCVEGSHDAIEHSHIPRGNIVQHDYSKGPWWPEETYDVAWSTEFLEHLGRQHTKNYMPTFKRAALVFITSSGWGGYHHVEVHSRTWWIARFEAQGLVYSQELTENVRSQVRIDTTTHGHGQQLGGLMVFINVAVASLPKHNHIMGGNGCYDDNTNSIDNLDNGIACTGADELLVDYQSLLECKKRKTPGNDNFDALFWQCSRNKKVVVK